MLHTVQEDTNVTYTELITVPAYMSGLFLVAALAQLLLGTPLYSVLAWVGLSAGSLTNYIALVIGTRHKLAQGLTRLSAPLLGIRWVLASLAAILVTLPLAFVMLHHVLGFERIMAVLLAASVAITVAFLILWRAPRSLR